MQIVSNTTSATVPMLYNNSYSTYSTYSTSSTNCNTIYYAEDLKLTFKYSDQCAIFLQPFEILIKKETIKGDSGYKEVRWIHTVNLEGFYLKTFWNKSKYTEEELSLLLEEEAKKWLDKQMKSTLKIPTMSSG